MSYVSWMKKLICHNSSGQLNLRFPGFRQIKYSVRLSTRNYKISFQYPALVAYDSQLVVVLSKTFQITKTFHVAMLQRYKGFWDSAYDIANSVKHNSLQVLPRPTSM